MAEKEPNDQFREARENTASPTHPKECLSRQEVAERANTWIWEHHNEKYDLNAKYIGKIEQGVIRWPNALRREAFRVILDVPQDSELGFINARARLSGAVVKLKEVNNTKRKKFIGTTTVGVSGLLLGKLLGEPVAALLADESTPIPDRVGATEIEQIRSAKQVFQSWNFTYGGGIARDAMRGQLRWSAGLLKATCAEQLRPELFSAVGDLADTAGCMALDAGADEQARRVLSFALGCAEKANDWPLRAEILSDMTSQAILTGQPDEALTLAEQALVRPDRLTATVLAMLHTDRANALARMHQGQETLRAIGTADEYFANSTPDNDPPFMAFYHAGVHTSYTGRRLADLAILGGDPGEATDRLTTAVTGQLTGYVRAQAICLGKLASLTMATGDPLQAAAIGQEALEVAGSIRSRIAAEGLRELHRHAAAHQDLEEVEHLRHRITTLLGTQNP